MGAFLFGGKEMAVHKCRRCVWSDDIDAELLYCILPRCIMKEEVTEQVTTTKESIISKKIHCYNDKRKRSKNSVSKKAPKAL